MGPAPLETDMPDHLCKRKAMSHNVLKKKTARKPSFQLRLKHALSKF